MEIDAEIADSAAADGDDLDAARRSPTSGTAAVDGDGDLDALGRRVARRRHRRMLDLDEVVVAAERAAASPRP